MNELVRPLLQHGSWILFSVVLAEQAGLPVPSIPVLLGIGALAGDGNFNFGWALAIALIASLIGDFLWYGLGRMQGNSILNLLCRISLEPDSCVSRTRDLFARLGPYSLLVAKFVPGLSTAAPPMAGLTRMNVFIFALADGIGSVIWAGAYLLLGFFFRRELTVAADYAMRMGVWLLVLVALLFGAYLAWKAYERRRFIRDLRVARITPEELFGTMQSGEKIVVVDLRHSMEIRREGKKIPGAIWMDARKIDERSEEFPRDEEVILYCS